MVLKNLPLLYQNMKDQNIDRIMFNFDFRNLRFSVIYIAEEFPHELLFGCVAHNLTIIITVDKDFRISTYIDNYQQLLNALQLKFDPDKKFTPSVLFEAFDETTPTSTAGLKRPTISDIAINRRDVEESEKIYFLKWRSHNGIDSRPTQKNLEKTRKICGLAAYDFCRRHNISSCWTDQKHLQQQYHFPGNN